MDPRSTLPRQGFRFDLVMAEERLKGIGVRMMDRFHIHCGECNKLLRERKPSWTDYAVIVGFLVVAYGSILAVSIVGILKLASVF